MELGHRQSAILSPERPCIRHNGPARDGYPDQSADHPSLHNYSGHSSLYVGLTMCMH